MARTRKAHAISNAGLVSPALPSDSTPVAAPTGSKGGKKPPPQKPKVPEPKQYDLADRAQLVSLFKDEADPVVRKHIAIHIKKILKTRGLENYVTLLLYDNCDSLTQFHSNAIYEEVSALAPKSKDILLIVQSRGGSIEAGYLISKTCIRLAKSKFVVAVPRRAKSAATLLALGADEIHMGLMSELGPVDPQIDGYPALGLINSIDVLADTVCKHPESAELFARYLSRNLKLNNLGYFVRVPESAVQYGERLLRRNEKLLPKGSTARTVADHFVNHYKDHGFVIDIDEAMQILGGIVKSDSDEYGAANEIFKLLDLVERFARLFKKRDFWYVGSIDSGMAIWRDIKN